MYIYLNGKFVPEEKAHVPIFDHGFLYGDGISETVRVYDGKFFALDRHLERFIITLSALHIAVPWTTEALDDILRQVVKKNRLRDGRIRLMATRGSDFNLVMSGERPNLYAIPQRINPQEIAMIHRGASARLVKFDRPLPTFKSLNFLPNVLAKLEAGRSGDYEALLMNREKHVLEGATSNVFMVSRGRVLTPQRGILKGVTREVVIQLCKKHKIPVEQRVLTKTQVLSASEVFLTSSVYEIVPILTIDGKRISKTPGPVTRKVQEYYRDYIHRTIA